ncbi:Uncharacterised protein [Enterobacter cloacae]|nr:Uncharacterised protein [Enterobacter cloacae]
MFMIGKGSMRAVRIQIPLSPSMTILTSAAVRLTPGEELPLSAASR